MEHFKGTCSRLVKFAYNFFLPQNLYISSMKPSLHSATFSNLLYGEKRYAQYLMKEKINKRTLNFNDEIESYLSFPIKLHYAVLININVS